MRFKRELLKGVASVVVLEVLSRGSMYGYELSDAIEKRSRGILTLGRGTLYPLLYNLEARGLVKGTWQESDSGRKRRYYTLTSAGQDQLLRGRAEWEQLQIGANAVLDAPPGTPPT